MDKRYEEALERARQGLPIDDVFPELKESDDERIRKAIGAAICGTVAISILEANGTNLTDALSYLKKQKEPLTPEEKMNHPLYLEGFCVGKKVGKVLKEQKQPEVDLEKELIQWHEHHFKKKGIYEKHSGFYLEKRSQLDLARHFYELGLNARKEE